MWWRSPFIAGLLLATGLPLASCGFQPLYGSTATGSRMSEVMAAVDVTPIPGRVSQRLHNELIFANTGGNYPAPTKYRLETVVKESVSHQNVHFSGDATGQVYQLEPTFKLINVADGRVLFEVAAMSRAPYERYQEIYSNVRARYDAENRAARTVAESIRTRLYLSSS
jgi:LPS-assembly lipoprotein